MDLKGVELFRTGRWNDIKNFTRGDLTAMAASFAELKLAGRVPLKLGHNEEQPLTDGQPALGWLDRLWLDDDDVLRGDFTQMPKIVYDAVKNGLYNFVSVELLRDVAYQGSEYPWVLSAVALLGADIPAVSGLKGLQALAMSRKIGFRSGARLTFTREVNHNGDYTMGQEKDPSMQEILQRLDGLSGKVEKLTSDNATLTADNSRLKKEASDREATILAEKVRERRTAIKERFDRAITDKVIRPSSRELFEKQSAFKDDKTVLDISLDNVETFIKENTVEGYRPPNKSGDGGRDSRGDEEEGDDNAPPDIRVRNLAFSEVQKSGGKLTHFEATKKVLRANPKLAEDYRNQPGQTGGKAA